MGPIEKDKAALAWIGGAWDDYLNGAKVLLPVLLAQAAFSAPAFYLIDKYHSYLPAIPYLILIVMPLSTGMNLVYIKLSRGSGARVSDMFSAFPVYPRALAAGLWLGVITAAGMLAFLAPGFVLYLTYCFSEYAVVDRRCGVKEAFSLSSALTLGWRGRLFFIFLLLVLADILVPDIAVVGGSIKSPQFKLNLEPWTIAASVLKTFVFLPWLHMAMARAYNFLLARPLPASEERQPGGS